MSYALAQTAAGYALFKLKDNDTNKQLLGKEVEPEQYRDLLNFDTVDKAKSLVDLVSIMPFKDQHQAQEITRSPDTVHDILRDWLAEQLPEKKKKLKFAVSSQGLLNAISKELGVKKLGSELSRELLRGIRQQLGSLIDIEDNKLAKMRLGLSHSISRRALKLNVNRVDHMIVQAIALLDDLEKDINTIAMRAKEWYGWHFPELCKIIVDNDLYLKLIIIGDRKALVDPMKRDTLMEILEEEEKVTAVVDAAKISMGTAVSVNDIQNVSKIAAEGLNLMKYREELKVYLDTRMDTVAPNLKAFIGRDMGARLIAHVGSLIKLAKAPASTIQILGAEKALFRALKTKGSTPKYGHLYNSTYIGRAQAKNKGKISRFIAAKTALCARVDCFNEKEEVDAEFGVHCMFQTEARLKNLDGIKVTKEQIAEELKQRAEKIKAEKATKKRYSIGADVVLTPKKEGDAQKEKEEDKVKEEEDKVTKEEKQKKKKKKKRSLPDDAEEKPKKKSKIKEEKVKEEDDAAEDAPKKKKKKKKKKSTEGEE